MTPDPKQPARVRDKELLRELHHRWRECALCGETDRLSLHHILKRPRDDIQGNLVMLCGDGVRGCHGRIESHDGPTEQALMTHILSRRPDAIAHLIDRLGAEAAWEWIEHRMS